MYKYACKNVENCKSKWGWQYLLRSTEIKILCGYLQIHVRGICVYPTCKNPSCYLIENKKCTCILYLVYRFGWTALEQINVLGL